MIEKKADHNVILADALIETLHETLEKEDIDVSTEEAALGVVAATLMPPASLLSMMTDQVDDFEVTMQFGDIEFTIKKIIQKVDKKLH